ncbi:hypothetical protein OESDEN_03052 [Oesophagostomum dentatum]|uniref:Acyltransferase n=1 Tax=Oesophagostomum dentatum TaxID=61180 RepID=A0A0B1TMB6_OESDE|nr:hypothetical protein OESDEN_03052 [Oesophagostomum dentatum]
METECITESLPLDLDETSNKDSYACCALFFLTVAVPFFWSPLPSRLFRLMTTFASAVLISMGRKHVAIFPSKRLLVFIGDMSYALYLFHWPIYVVVKYHFPDNPLGFSGPFFGVFVSLSTARLAYEYYETTYLRWSPPTIALLIVCLLGSSVILSLNRHSVEMEEMNSNLINYTEINVKDAAWNLTLARLLVSHERQSHMWNEGCTYSNKFVNVTLAPRGFCSMKLSAEPKRYSRNNRAFKKKPGVTAAKRETTKNGSGVYDFLVLGNSFACNQGDLVYNAFNHFARKFDIFCLSACEVMTPTFRDACTFKLNYTHIVEELKPDVVFIICRSVSTTVAFDATKPITEDKWFKIQLEFLTILERMVKKVWI